MKKAATLLVVLLLAGFGYYHYFVETLMFSDIIGRTNVPVADVFVNLLDFDTGLTRYNIYNLQKKSGYWNRRIREVQSIQDYQMRKDQESKLVAEIMEDPSIKKIVRKLFVFGTTTTLSILKGLF